MEFIQEVQMFIEPLIREAGRILLSHRGKKLRIRSKESILSLVTSADTASERFLCQAIRKRFPEHGLLAEEGTQRASSRSVRWIIDPLDGTTNYTRGLPFYSISIALEREQELVAGWIYVPELDILYAGIQGQGSFKNRQPIRVSRIRHLGRSVLATGFPYDLRQRPRRPFELFQRFCLQALAVRRYGSASIDLALVAEGAFDGFWEEGLQPWDVAAGAVLIREAGGKITDFSGKKYTLNLSHDSSTGIVAANSFLHASLIKNIGEAGTGNFTL